MEQEIDKNIPTTPKEGKREERENIVEKLSVILECPICKTLEILYCTLSKCQHSFCNNCLAKVKNNPQKDEIICPLCREASYTYRQNREKTELVKILIEHKNDKDEVDKLKAPLAPKIDASLKWISDLKEENPSYQREVKAIYQLRTLKRGVVFLLAIMCLTTTSFGIVSAVSSANIDKFQQTECLVTNIDSTQFMVITWKVNVSNEYKSEIVENYYSLNALRSDRQKYFVGYKGTCYFTSTQVYWNPTYSTVTRDAFGFSCIVFILVIIAASISCHRLKKRIKKLELQIENNSV